MVAVPVLITIEGSAPVLQGARSAASSSMVPTTARPPSADVAMLLQAQLPLRTLRVDEGFAPVPTERRAVSSITTMSAAPAGPFGPLDFAVRGTLDDSEIGDAANVRDSQGNVRIFADPRIEVLQTCGSDPAVGDVNDVRRLLGVGRLRRLGMDGSNVAIAIVDNGVNLAHLRAKGLNPGLDSASSWSPRYGIPPGGAPVDHGTMCAYDALIAAPKATLIDSSLLQSTRRGGSAMDGLLSDAIVAFGRLLTMMLMPDDERHFHSLVVSNSWGMYSWKWDFPRGHPGRYGDNPNHLFSKQVAALSAAGADILFAAGNCGPICPDGRCDNPLVYPTINGANSHPDVITVGGADTSRLLVGYSSVGPGALSNDKPDITSFTHFLGSEAFGPGTADSGTSAACPVMAGVVAAVRSKYPFDAANTKRTPGNIKQFLLSQARHSAGPAGWRNDYGHGIVDTGSYGSASAIA